MPLYDFSCPACGTRFEARAAVDERIPCPVCRAAPASRVPTSFATSRSPALRGVAARRSESVRAAREEQRRERREQRAAQRREQGSGGGASGGGASGGGTSGGTAGGRP